MASSDFRSSTLKMNKLYLLTSQKAFQIKGKRALFLITLLNNFLLHFVGSKFGIFGIFGSFDLPRTTLWPLYTDRVDANGYIGVL